MYIKSVLELTDKYDNFIVDVWGVIHNGYTVFDGVIETLELLKGAGKSVIFLSNTPRRTYVLADNLKHMGVTPEMYTNIHTSGEDTYEHLSQDKDPFYAGLSRKCYLITSLDHEHLIEDCKLTVVDSINEASFIFNTGPDHFLNMTEEHFKEILQEALKKDLPMICVNPDMSVIVGDKKNMCAGSIALYYEQMGGRVRYHGKPFTSIYEGLIQKFPTTNKSRTVAIGDSIRTDIKGANDFGIDSILVMTGLEGSGMNPDKIESQLEEFLANAVARPTYVLKGFR
jgi:HAD superfamily hydrolase (TIGR01459 family)